MDDDDFDDAELWAAADRVASASQAPHRIVQPTPQRIERPSPYGTEPRAHDHREAAPPAGQKIIQPTPQVLPQRGSGSHILVSPRQKGNPVLSCIKSTTWEYSDIPADYGLGLTTCALFLSLKYHRLYPEYIYTRIRNLQGRYSLRILLTMVDIANHEDPLRELAKTSLVNNVTLILCWSAAEAARYLELYKSYEHAGFKAIQGYQGTTYVERLVDFVTVPRGINKADAVSLVSNFGSLKNAINADPEQIGIIGGWGEVKVKRWGEAIDEPFRIKRTMRTFANESLSLNSVDPRITLKTSLGPLSVSTKPALAAAASRTSPKPDPVSIEPRRVDDEDPSLAQPPGASKRIARPAQPGAPVATVAPETLSEGVAAALARLREQG